MDKIFVNNYLKEVEIGAFQSERGCTQRVEFNVCLEIKPISDEVSDNVDRILSYEVITEAINYELQSQRFNLLETLAERIAERCLTETRVIRADVKIEKLDRIPGSLGISISRVQDSNIAEKARMNSISVNEFVSLVNFSAINIDSEMMRNWVSTLIESKLPVAIIIEPLSRVLDDTFGPSIKNQVDLLAMDQKALLASALDGRLGLASTKAELEWGLKLKRVILFCPSNFVKQSLSTAPILKNNSSEFSGWLARKMGIKNLFFVGPNLKKEKVKEDGLEIMYLDNDDWNSFR